MARSVTESGPHPVDIHVGGRVRLRRTLLGMNQGKLAEALGLAFQQVQKYERGANRISSSKLYQLSQILDVPVSIFFDDMPADVAVAGGGHGIVDADQDPHDPKYHGEARDPGTGARLLPHPRRSTSSQD